MINLTNILGTDSLSASRLTLNDNFKLIQDHLNSSESILNTQTGTLNLPGKAAAGSLEIRNNSQLEPLVAEMNSTSILLHKPVSVNKVLNVNGSIKENIHKISSNSIGEFTQLDNSISNNIELNISVDSSEKKYRISDLAPGNKLTIVNTGTNIALISGLIGVSHVKLLTYGTLEVIQTSIGTVLLSVNNKATIVE